jgi:hypothetical protein
MAATARRLATIPVAAKIGSHDAEMFSESRAKLAPNNMGVRVAMQEEDRRASTSSGDPNDDAIRDLDVIEREPRHQRASPISRTILIMAFHPDRILRRPPVRQSPCKPGGIARPLTFLGRTIGLLR